MALTCGKCGFDLESFEAVVDFSGSDLPGDHRNLQCPVCPDGAAQLFLKDLGIVRRQAKDGKPGKLIQWTRKGDRTPVGDRTLGALRIRVKSTDIEAVESPALCYKSVPAFLGASGLEVPDVPLRPGFLDLVDFDAIARKTASFERGHIEGGLYKARVPLLGRAEPLVVSLPVAASTAGKAPTSPQNDAFSDVALTVWPDVPFADWKFFRVELATTGKALFEGWPEAQIQFGLNRNPEARTIGPSHDARCRFAVVEDGRPQWAALELSPDVGGIFFLDPALTSTQGTPPLPPHRMTAAIDFGTSNTFFAFSGPHGETVPLPIRNLSRTIFGQPAGTKVREQEVVSMSPPHRGFGGSGDLLPSELLVRDGGTQLEISKSRSEDWTPFLDYAIPSAGVTPLYPEKSHVVAEFKFDALEGKPGGGSFFQRYIEAYLLLQLAHAFADATKLPAFNALTLKYSYPGVLSQAPQSLGPLYRRVGERIRNWTGVALTVEEFPIDEARAAGRNAVNAHDGIRLYVDMGGGTTDIALFFQNVNGLLSPVYLTSIGYAGRNTMEAFTGSGPRPQSCLQPGEDLEKLRRAIREATRFEEVANDKRLFNPNRKSVLEKRLGLFFGYLQEFLARLVAAAIIDPRSAQAANELKLRLNSSIRVDLVLLGNGWGFLSALPKVGTGMLASQLAVRTNSILAAHSQPAATPAGEGTPETGPRVKVELSELKRADVPHPKAAVAFGLLAADTDEKIKGDTGDGEAFRQRTIVGQTTHVNNFDPSKDVTVDVPWWMPVESSAHLENAPIALGKNSSMYWKLSDAPQLPPQIELSGIEKKLDPLLGKLHHDTLPPEGPGADWFQKSPFEVLMEELFAKSIPTEVP